jgi:DNA-binding MarR family transcriptional regulator
MRGIRQIFDDLVRFETVLWAEVDARLRRQCTLSLGSLNVMMVVDATPDCRVYDIARALEITVGGASQAVDRLESAGRCARRANPADRRSSLIELTGAGRTLLGEAVAVFDEELDRLLREPLGQGDLDRLGTTLATLRRAASGAGPQP